MTNPCKGVMCGVITRSKAIAFAVSLILILGIVSVPPAQGQDLQNDDLLVGAGTVDIWFGNLRGVVWRLRGGSLDKFCESSARPFFTPGAVTVDTKGQVVFLAGMPSDNIYFPHVGLFRCKALGAVPELLAVFPGIGNTAPGDPVPFPGQTFFGLSGLHLARAVAASIDDQVNDGNPQLGIEDVYVLVAGQFNPNTGQVVAVRTVRYHTAGGVWDEGPPPCVDADCPGVFTSMPTAINHAGVTYFTRDSGYLRRVKDPLQVNISGNLPPDVGGNFGLKLSLFGGTRQIKGLDLDYVNLPHVPSECPPNPPVSGDMPFAQGIGPPGFNGMSGFQDVVFDEWGDLGLVLVSNSYTHSYQANVSEALLDKPGDLSQYFENSYNGCQAEPSLKVTFIMPTWSPEGDYNLLGSLVSAPSGIAGTANQQVARLAPGSDRLQVLANHDMFPDLHGPVGLGAYPPTASVGGVVVVLRSDSQANMLVTAPDGRRIGVDPVSGQSVNDFGDDGFDSGPGVPHFYALRNAAPGVYSVQSIATTSGSFAVHVYSTDQTQPVGNHIVASGIAQIGDINSDDFTLDPTGGIGFLGPGAAPGTSILSAAPTPGR